MTFYNCIDRSLNHFWFRTKFYVREKIKINQTSYSLRWPSNWFFQSILKCYQAQNFMLRLCTYEKSYFWKFCSLFSFAFFFEKNLMDSFSVTCEHARWRMSKLHSEGFQVHVVECQLIRVHFNACGCCVCWPRTSWLNIQWPCKRIKIYLTGIHLTLFSPKLCRPGLFLPFFQAYFCHKAEGNEFYIFWCLEAVGN